MSDLHDQARAPGMSFQIGWKKTGRSLESLGNREEASGAARDETEVRAQTRRSKVPRRARGGAWILAQIGLQARAGFSSSICNPLMSMPGQPLQSLSREGTGARGIWRRPSGDSWSLWVGPTGGPSGGPREAPGVFCTPALQPQNKQPHNPVTVETSRQSKSTRRNHQSLHRGVGH